MGTSGFLIALLLGATGIAFWTSVRFPRLAPTTPRWALLHVVFSGVAAQLALPSGLGAIGAVEGPPSALAVLAVALPALTYLMLASIWLLMLARQLLGGYR